MLLRTATCALALSATASAHSAHVIRRQDPPASSAVPSSTGPDATAPSAAPSDAPTEPAAPIDPDAKGCAAVNLAYKAAAAGTSASIKPSIALECLMSVPLDVPRDIALIEWILPYLSFQSTVGYLKKPPKGYLLPPVDIIGGALAIRQKLRTGGYKLQYEFVMDIKRMIVATADSHISYSPALVDAIQWQRTLNITSMSPDGLELPKIYDVNDITSPGGSISDIETIDDKPVQDFLAEAAAQKGSQDPDAQYNELFWSAPAPDAGFMSSYMPLPDAHVVKFTNGSTRTYENKAVIIADFSAITTGEELHNAVEIPPETPAVPAVKNRRQETETVEMPPAVTQVPHYPNAVVVQYHGYMAGYFLNESTHPDTAVLAAINFEPQGDREPLTEKLGSNQEYHNTRKFLAEFIALCKKNGRTKLIIDLSGNGGGLLLQGFEMYRTLFPTGKTYTGSRFRANAAMNILGAATYGKPEDEKTVMAGFYLNPATSQRYPDWAALYGPASFPEDKVSNLFSWDLTNPKNTEESTGTFLIAGFDPAYPLGPPPFKAEDITILTDGKCASTCTVFVSLMVHEQKVRTIALGGRPLAQPMQALGGVKGCLVITFESIYTIWNDIISRFKPSIPTNLLPGLPTNATPPLMPVDMKSNLNFRNAHLEKDPNGPPTHFLYEAANCRRFYKGSYLNDITTLWDDIADIAWKGGKCAPGSTPDAEGKISDAVVGFSDKVMSKVSIYDGPGSQTNQEWLALAGKNMTGTTEGLSNGVGRVSGSMIGVAVAVVVAMIGIL